MRLILSGENTTTFVSPTRSLYFSRDSPFILIFFLLPLKKSNSMSFVFDSLMNFTLTLEWSMSFVMRFSSFENLKDFPMELTNMDSIRFVFPWALLPIKIFSFS